MKVRNTINPMVTLVIYSSLIVLMLGITASSWAQEATENAPIVADKKLLSYKYTYKGENIGSGLSFSKFKTIMRDYPDALAKVETAEKFVIPAMILSVAGGALIGWPIGQAIGGEEDPNWTLAGAGGGLLAVGISLGVVSEKHLKKGVDIYNTSIGPSSDARSLDLELAFAPHRISIVLRL